MWDDVRGLQQVSLPCQPIYSSQPFPTAGCEWLCLLPPWGCRTGAPPYNPALRWVLPNAVNSQTSLCPVTSTSFLAMQEAVPSFAGPSACWGAPSTHSVPIFAEASGILWETWHPAPLPMFLGTAQLLWDLSATDTQESCHCYLPPSCRRQ